MKQSKKKQLRLKPPVRKRGPAVLRLKSERVQSVRVPAQRRDRGGPLLGRLLGLARRTVRRVNRGQKHRQPFH
jgi:hypothetical protein